MISRLRNLLGLSYVPRWTTHPLVRQQNVAEHCYRTAILVLEIHERLPASSRNGYVSIDRMLRWALVHDGPECLIGDIPAPAKLEFETPKNLFEKHCPWYAEEHRLVRDLEEGFVKVADTLEALSWIQAWGHKVTKDHFTGESVEHQLRRYLHTEAKVVKLDGFYDAVMQVLEEVAP